MEKREHFDRLRQPRCLLLLLAAGHVMVAGHLASNDKDTAGTESEFSFAEVVERGDRFPVVKTTSGLLRGERADFEALAISPIIRFLSVPYASPPLGDLRFTLPRDTSPWMGVRNATALSAPCMQLPKGEVLETDGGGEGPWGRAQGAENNTEDEKESDEDWEGDEDCLYLNIYAPATAGPPRDCMVFLHGGGFVTGSARAFDPSILATIGDIIVVTLNYRLGPFGFLPEGEARGNAGLHDIAAALRWVHQNLPHFGGRGGRSGVKVSSGTRRTRGGTFDPGEGVTLAGWGAGATAASLLSLSQQTEGLISRLILQSGGALSLWSPSPSPSPAPRRSTLYSLVERLAVSLSCPLHGPVLLCLRRAPARDVALAAAQFPLTTFQPTIDFAFLGSSPKGLLQSGEFLNHEVLMGVTTSEAARLAPPSDLSRPRLRRQITKNLEEPDHEIRQGFNILQGFEPDFEENNILQDAALSTLPGIGLKNIPPSSLPDAGSSQHFASTENSLVLPNSLTSNFGTNPQAPLTASFTTTISVPRQQPTALSVAHSAPLSPQIPAPLSAPLTASLPPSLHCRLVSRPPSPPVPDPHDPWGVRFEAAVQWVTRRHSGSGQSAAGTALGAAVRFMYTDWAAAGEGGTWSGEMNSQEERIGQTNMERENNGESDTFKERSGKLVEEGIEREKERKKVTQWNKKKDDREHSRTTKEKEKSRVRMSRWREQTIALLSDALFLSPAMAEAELRARFGSVIYLYALTGSCGGGRHGEKPNKRKKRGIEEKKVNKTMASMKLPLQEREGHQRKTKQWSKKGEMGNLDKMMTAINERWRERIEKRKGLRRIKVRSEEGFKRDHSESEKQNIEKDGGRTTQRNEDENDERERKKHIAHKVRARKRSKDKREKEMQQEKLIMTTSRCDQSKTRRVKSRRLRREVSERERREVERENDIRWERDRKSWREAGHGDELAYMFGLPWLSWKRSKIREGGGGSSKEYGQPSGIGGRCSYGERDAELSFLIMMYWANFVKTGNPNLRVPLTDSAGEVFTEQKADVDLQIENAKVGIDVHLENSKTRGNEKRTNFQPAILDQTSSEVYPNVPLVTQGLKPSLLDDGNWAKKSDLPRHFEPLWPRFSTSRRRYLTLGSRIRVRFNLRATRLAFWSRLVPVLMATGNTRSSPRRYYPRPCFRGPHASASKENWGERAAGRELEAEHEKGESWGLSYTLACGSAFLFLNLVAVAALNYVRDRGANQGGFGIRGHRGQNRRGWGIGSGSWGLIENRGLGPGDWGLASDNQGLGVGDWGLGSDSRGLATGSWGASEPDLFPTVDYVFTLRRSPHDLLPWREASGRTGGENRHEEEHEGETELRRC